MTIKEYKGVDAAALQAELDKAMDRRSGSSSFTSDIVRQSSLPKGTTKSPKPTKVRILPPGEGHGSPWVAWEQHIIFVPSAGKKVFFNCLRAAGKGKCPGCELAKMWKDSKDPETQKMGHEGRAKAVYAANVIFLDWGGEPVPEDKQGVKIFSFGSGIYRGTDKTAVGGLLSLLQEFDFTHPIDGCAVSIAKNVDGPKAEVDTSYSVSLCKKEEMRGRAKILVPDFTPLADSEESIDAILAASHNMDFLTKVKTYDDLVALTSGQEVVTPRLSTSGARPALPSRTIGAEDLSAAPKGGSGDNDW